MFEDLPLWANFLIRSIAIVIIIIVMFLLVMFFPVSCSYGAQGDWEYIGSATFSHLEYKPIDLDPYTIYYMQNGKVYPIYGMQDEFERGQLVHIYRKQTIDGYEYKVFEDPIHKVKN